jgi:hypothetical protein
VLERCGGNKREACRVLGISYHTLQAYVKTPIPTGLEDEPFDDRIETEDDESIASPAVAAVVPAGDIVV